MMKLRYIWFLTLVSVRVAFAQPLSLSRSTFVNRSNQLYQDVAWPYLLRSHNFIPPKENKAQLLPEAMSTHATTVQRSWLSSMVIPGLGQMYNKHYWKIPFFYLGFLLGGIKIHAEHNEMHKYERIMLDIEKKEKMQGGSSTASNLPSRDFTKRRINECRRARNLFILITAVWYILNILDAYAGEHGKMANFQDDIKVEPSTAAAVEPAALAMASACPFAATISLVTFSFPIHFKKNVL
ncbi:MAG: DUF5683 domain-containing protein [Candidatus Cardinium sp.]|nr:DUF5683 domain-containing protein [Candidatus Cardinium sp.]